MKLNRLIYSNVLLAACLVSFANPIWAFDELKAEPVGIHVQIGNATGASCQQIDQVLIHGNLDSLPPQVINTNDSKAFSIFQSVFYGPDLILAYQCGTNTIRFKVQQDHSDFVGKLPKVIILENRGIRIKSSSGPSNIWGAPGLIDITLLPDTASK